MCDEASCRLHVVADGLVRLFTRGFSGGVRTMKNSDVKEPERERPYTYEAGIAMRAAE